MSRRKKLIAQLEKMEKTLHYQQIKVLEHKQYCVNMITNHGVTLLVMLLPAFLWGWKRGREKGLGPIIKQLMQGGLFASFSHIKRQIVSQKG